MLSSPNTEEQSEISETEDAYSSDFIPYACHYDPDTVITKNGSLLQVIAIKGFAHNAKDEVDLNVRKTIRDSIFKNIKSPNIGIYFHTIRQARNLDKPAKFKSYFADQLHTSWVAINHWNSKYVNNLYITLISPGSRAHRPASQASKKTAFDTHGTFFDAAHKELSSAVDSLLQDLKSHGAVKLSIVDIGEQNYCSEVIKFFNKIMHIEERDFLVCTKDISKDLRRYGISFGYNEMQISKEHGKIFSAIFSIKESEDIHPEALGGLLQLPYQMVITQSVTFVDKKVAQQSFQRQNYLITVSKDTKFAALSGLDEANAIKDSPNSFCRVQTTIMITSGNLEKLRSDSTQLYKALCDLGIPAVKEDLNLEHCFWSQLPGNFSYNVRIGISLSSQLGVFALLNNCPFGSLKSKWGDPVTILTTALGTPYFFHFHENDNSGHTLVVGDNETSKIVLTNFLLSEASKFDATFIYLDAYKQSQLYIQALGVEYSIFNFDAAANKLRLNPLLLEDNKANRGFLRYWFLFLLNLYTTPTSYRDYLPIIDKAIEILFTLPREKRLLRNAAEFFVDTTSALTTDILQNLQEWHSNGKLAHIFDNDSDFMINNLGASFGLDVSDIYETSMRINLPVIMYILHFYREYFTGKGPSILCVSWSNRLFNSIYFEKNLSFILEDLAKRNAVCLFTASFCSKEVNWSETIGKIYNKKMATKIFMADNAPSYPNLMKLFDFDQDEKMYLQSLSEDSNQFLLKQGQYSTIMALDLTVCPREEPILRGNGRYASEANDMIQKYGKDPSIWLPKLYAQVESETEPKNSEPNKDNKLGN